MAGLGKKTFAAGEVLRAADVNGYLMDQAVQVYAGTAARGSAIGTATEGMVTWLSDSNTIEAYDGASWMNVANTGRGIVAFNGTPTGTNITAGVPLTIMTTTFTAYPGRKYRFTGRFTFQLGNTSTVRTLYIWNNTIGNVALHYTTVGMASSNYNDTFQGSVTLNSAELGVTSSPVSGYGVEMRFYTGSTGTLNTNPDGVLGAGSNRTQLLIEDIGVSS